jgi:GNAT superfamily N-acetyltransferase
MTLAVRFATSRDAELVHQLIVALAHYEREPDAVEVTVDGLRAQLASERPPFECLIAEEAGEPRGFALFFHSYSTWTGKQGIYLEDLFVPEEHRGQGVGRRLLSELAALALERGCARLEWSVLDWNQPSIDFYEALGATAMRSWIPFRIAGAPLAALARKKG